jgi:uncharacterized membrane protein (UPF0182 family)
MAETLDGALAQLFGGSTAARVGPVPAAAVGGAAAAPGDAAFRALTAEARQRYQSAMDALRGGDFARYGEEIRRLGELLDRIAAGPAVRR